MFVCSNTISPLRAKQKDALSLAFVGDGVHTLFAREYVCGLGDFSSHVLHQKCSFICNAYSQGRALEKIWQTLDENEIEIAKRARNHKLGHTPKNADLAAYKNATAYEALVGYFYLTGQTQKLDACLAASIAEKEN